MYMGVYDKSRDQLPYIFEEFHEMAKIRFDAEAKVFRSNNGGKKTSSVFQGYLQVNGIESRSSCL